MSSIFRITKKDLRKFLPKRADSANKTHGGKCLIIAGSEGMWGACYLSALAALRVGAGYVYLPSTIKNLTEHPDFLSYEISEKMNLNHYKALAIGPGITITPKIKKLFHHIEKEFNNPVIIDAGALELVKKIKTNWIITPHEGELAKLLNISSDEIRKDRFKAAQMAQEKFGGIIVLKGHHTLVATKSMIYKIQTGNKALAKAGTGDVLTGMIVGFLSQGLKPTHAAVLACGVHGYIADRWVKDKDYLSLMASDLIDEIPRALFTLRKKK
ncbi:MAG: NAD(P)H-hydrate dehydratase [Pseudobdellovibrio sp.]|nr:NAD(P)H-hydrate dehydratase [Pseudobdellovibrio sp.]